MSESASRRPHACEAIGIALVVAGEFLIALHRPAFSDYYFPIVWFGYILVLYGFLGRTTCASHLRRSRPLFLLMIPISAGFWWLFEAFNLAVSNWRYTGGGAFSGVSYVALASVSFSTVLPAVWLTALCVQEVLTGRSRNRSGIESERWSLSRLLSPKGIDLDRLVALTFCFGIACVILPILLPRYTFGLIWVSLFFLLDPVNYRLGRPSLVQHLWVGRLTLPLSFAVAGPICGFFWEAWNYWSVIKWVYNIPFVSQLHLFEMPLPGYLGYIPFGLELFAMTVFVLPWAQNLVFSTPAVVGRTVELPQSLMPSSAAE